MRSSHHRCHEARDDHKQEAPPQRERKEGDDRREAQCEPAKPQGRYCPSYWPHDRGRYVIHEVVEHPQDPVRRVGGEPADQDPRDDEAEDDLVGVVNEADEQHAHLDHTPSCVPEASIFRSSVSGFALMVLLLVYLADPAPNQLIVLH